MGDPFRIAVVGAGYWGPNLIRNFAATPGLEVAWVCDKDPARLREMDRRFRVGAVTTDYEEVIADASTTAVALATPISTHRPLGEAALLAGKHLWVEKPLARTTADAEALVQLARQTDRRLLVDHTFVYTPAVRKIRELIGAGELGEILYVDSIRVNLGLFQPDDNVLWDLGPHDLSIAQAVLGMSPVAVSAVGQCHPAGGRHEYIVYLTLRYAEDLIAHFHLNWLAPLKIRQLMIGGSGKMLVYDENEPVEKVKIYDKGIAPTASADVETRRSTLISYRTGDIWSPRLDQTEALALAAADFVDAIRNHRAPEVDGETALSIVRALDAAQRSLEAGGRFEAV